MPPNNSSNDCLLKYRSSIPKNKSSTVKTNPKHTTNIYYIVGLIKESERTKERSKRMSLLQIKNTLFGLVRDFENDKRQSKNLNFFVQNLKYKIKSDVFSLGDQNNHFEQFLKQPQLMKARQSKHPFLVEKIGTYWIGAQFCICLFLDSLEKPLNISQNLSGFHLQNFCGFRVQIPVT